MIYDLGILIEQDLLTGFHVGTHAEIPIAQDFYVQPGLLFSTKGAKEKEGDNEDESSPKNTGFGFSAGYRF